MCLIRILIRIKVTRVGMCKRGLGHCDCIFIEFRKVCLSWAGSIGFGANQPFLFLCLLFCTQSQTSHSLLIQNLLGSSGQPEKDSYSSCILHQSAPFFWNEYMLSLAISFFNRPKVSIIREVRMSRNHKLVVNNSVGKITARNNIHPQACNVDVTVLTVTSITKHD